MVTSKTRTCNGSFKNLWFLTYPAFGFLSGGNLQVVTIHLIGETVRIKVMIWFMTLSYNLFDIYMINSVNPVDWCDKLTSRNLI